jgi:hypothetical protein
MLKRQHRVGSKASGDPQRIVRLVDQEGWWRGREEEIVALF